MIASSRCTLCTKRGGEVEFEWDPKKAEANRRKPGIEFVDAVIVFDDGCAVTLLDKHPTEERYVTFGMDAQDICWPFLMPFAALLFE